MNSIPNSDSKQCPESKLGWVHRVHTQGLGCTRTALCRGAQGVVLWRVKRRILAPGRRIMAPGHRIVAPGLHVRRSPPAVSPPPPVTIQKLYRDPTLPRALRAMLLMHSAVSQRARCHVIGRVARCIATQRSPLAMIQHLYRDSPASQVALPHTLARGRPCRGSCWPCRGAVSQGLLAVSWPPATRPNTLCHNTIHFIVT